MDHRYLQLAALPGRFFEVPWAAGSPLLDGPLLAEHETATAGWRRYEHGPWLLLLPPEGGPLRRQGWKLHVAALPADAAATAAVCWEACRAFAVPLKVLRSRGLVLASQLKYAPPDGSGKVITCYPEPELLQPLAERLAETLRGRAAPRVLGELAVPGAPVHLRYGAFAEQWTVRPDGRAVPARADGSGLVPDVRGPAAVPPGVVPPYVARLRALSRAAEAGQVLDVVDVRVVHRSNAGGVYRALRPDGRIVLLKEARHHAGLDADGVDAPTRLRHELAVLRRLAGSGAAPEPIEHLRIGDSDILVTEWIEGIQLGGWLSRFHPLIRPEAVPGGEAYRRRVAGVVGRARDTLRALHERGVVHRDVQPANLIDTGDRVVAVDLESSTLDGHGVTTAIATPGFSAPADGPAGPAGDLHGLRRVEAMLLNPLTPVLHLRPDLEGELWRVGLADLGLDPEPEDEDGRAAPAAPEADALARGIRGAATPERADRLFPGDVEQFSLPRGALGLLHGAAGVLLALHRTGYPVDEAWTDWLAGRARAAGPFPRGLGSGADGVAWALARLGHPEAAVEVADRFVTGPEAGPAAALPWWQYGAAGRALALAGLAARLDRSDLTEAAAIQAKDVLAAVADPEEPAGYRPGLLAGWSGVGLGLLALPAGLLPEADVLAAARAALDRELHATRRSGDALLTAEGATLLPYLGRGAAASGWLALRLSQRTRDDGRLEAVVAGVLAACARRVSIFAGLLSGRAGLLAVLHALSAGAHPMVAEHRRRLSWQTIGDGQGGRLSLGDHNLRCSADLATGAAGLLAVLQPRPDAAVADLLGLTGPGTGETRPGDAVTPGT